jgi:hypothetical protein
VENADVVQDICRKMFDKKHYPIRAENAIQTAFSINNLNYPKFPFEICETLDSANRDIIKKLAP